MTARKPPRLSWESWVERQIREARERGDFDDLDGAGQPLADLDRPHDELWWVKKKLAEEGAGFLPPTLALRKDREDTLAALSGVSSETEARRRLEDLNQRIRRVNREATAGPPSTVMPVDVEVALQRWRERRGDDPARGGRLEGP